MIVDEPIHEVPHRPLRDTLAGLLQSSPALLPALVADAVFVGFAGYQAGYPPTVWYPGGILVGAALTTTFLSLRPPLARLPRATAGAVLFLAGFTAWSYLSILWSDQRGDAWDGANKTLLYLAVFALFALWPWRPAAAMLLMGLYAVGVAAIVGAYIGRAAASATPSDFLIGGRLAEPAGYPNAACALALGAFWLAAFLASRRETPWLARPVLLAAAGLTLEAGVLTQSRGSLVAVPVTGLLALAIVPGRIRLLLVFAVVGLVTYLFRGPLLDVYPARFDEPALQDALGDVVRVAILSAVVLAAVGLVAALLDRRLDLPEATRRVAVRGVGALAVAAAIATAVALVVTHGNPITRVERAWEDFTAVHEEGTYLGEEGSRFSGGLGSNRWDFWTVAVDQFEASPLAGAGVDNFALDYLESRRSFEEPRYAHSLELRILGGLGAVGAALFLGFVALALAAAHRARRSPMPLAAPVAAIGVVAFGYWAIHGSIDWFWEFPGLSAPAFAWLGLAVGLARRPPPTGRESSPTRGRRVAFATVGTLLALAALASTLPPWLAARDVDRAAATWREDPEAAFDRLDRARRLNPLSERADLIAGTIASRLDDRQRMRASFERAVERNPRNWYAHLQLAVVDSQEGEYARAVARLERALRLNPKEPTLALALETVLRREPIPSETLLRMSLDRVETVTS